MDTAFQPDRVLFPLEKHIITNTASMGRRVTSFFNRPIGTNEAQSQAVKSILTLPAGTPPFCVFGP